MDSKDSVKETSLWLVDMYGYTQYTCMHIQNDALADHTLMIMYIDFST